jgi:hypothetical protein
MEFDFRALHITGTRMGNERLGDPFEQSVLSDLEFLMVGGGHAGARLIDARGGGSTED